MDAEPKPWRDGVKVLGALAVVVALPGLGLLFLGDELQAWTSEGLGETWLATSALGILTLLAVGSIVPALGLLPSHAVAFFSGLIHGFWMGFPLALCALLLGVLLGQALGRRGLTGSLDRLTAKAPRVERYRVALRDPSSRRATTAVAVLRLSPLFPFAATNVFLGALALPLRRVLLASAIGLSPRIAILVAAGSGIEHLQKGSHTEWVITITLAVLSLLALTVIARRLEANLTS